MTGVQTCALPICFPVTIYPTVIDNIAGTNGEQENVRAFEILDSIIDEQFHQPVLWTDDDNCITEDV